MTTLEKDQSSSDDVSDIIEGKSDGRRDKSVGAVDHMSKWTDYELDDSLAEALVANGFKTPTEV